MRKRAFCIFLAFSLVLTACDGIIEVLYTSVTGISLDKTTLSLSIGAKEKLTATIEPANATTKTVIWTSSNPLVALVLDGVVTALIPGTATITATTLDGGKKATCEVTVNSASVTGVTLNKSALSLFVGDKETLTAAIAPADALIKTVLWTSSNPLVAVVSTSGLVTAFTPGTAIITAKTLDGGKTASCVVTVTTNVVVPVTGITLNKTSTRLAVGGTETLTAKITPSNASNQNVTWSSSNTAVARVSADGLITGISAGRAIITAVAVDGGERASCSVNVSANSVAVTAVYLSVESINLFLNDIQMLSARVEPDDATNQNVTWSSSDPSVAMVAGGLVMGVASGTAIITVTTEDGGKTAACAVTVSDIAVSGVSLNKTSAGLLVGGTETFYATIAPSNATNKNLTWSSGNPAVATVSTSGLVTAVAEGTAAITVTTEDSGKTATCTVTVSNVAVSGVTLNKTSASLFVGGTETLTAAIAPDDAANKSVTWSSGNTDVATVSTSGLVTGVSAGTVNITVTTADGGKIASCAVTVSNVAVSGVTLNKTSTSLLVGGTETLTATIAPANATNKNVSWNSSNNSIATVYNGVVTGLGAGTATITVTAEGGKTATCTVTVSNVAVTGVTLNKSSTSLFVGSTETLTATVTPADAANKNVSWSSGNNSIATVSNGVVTAVAAGTTVITATTVDGNKTASCIVTVNPVAVSGVTLNKSSTGIIVGNTETLTATIAPSNATNQNVTWNSGNSAVATVSGGVVTPVAVGSTVITATTVDGGKTATCNVTVYTNTVAVSGVTLNKSSTSLFVGGTETLTAAIAPSNATNQNVTWSSDNTFVATVTAGGAVTAVAAGTAVITVTTADQGKTAACTVIVNKINVTFNSVTANGSTTQTTTQLTLNFSQAIAGLGADNITLSGVTGVSKGTLGGSGPSYTLPISGFIAGGTLSVIVSSPSNYNISGSSKTTIIYYGTGTTTLSITFNQIADAAPNITGPTLYRVSNGGPTSAALTVDNPGQYDSISWRVQDTAVTGTGSSFTLSAGNAAYNLTGEHFVTVSVMKGGVPYNKTVSFKVEY